MTASFRAAVPAAGTCSWRGDARPDTRGGAGAVYVSDAPLQSEDGSSLTTETLAGYTTE
jgi:hypothetical protein